MLKTRLSADKRFYTFLTSIPLRWLCQLGVDFVTLNLDLNLDLVTSLPAGV